MQKKGQLTIFVLLGIVVVIATALILQLTQQPAVIIPAIDSITAVEQNIHSCWQSAAEDATTQIGRYGGTVLPFVYELNDTIRVAVTNGKVTVPTKTELENELSYGIAVLTSHCEADIIERAAQHGITLTEGTTLVSTTLLKDHTILVFQTDITATQQSTSTDVDDHIVVLNTPLGHLASLAHKIATDVAENGDIDLSSIENQGVQANIRGGASSINSILLTKQERAPNMTATFLVAFDQQGERASNPPKVEQSDPILAPAGKQTLGVVIAQDPLGEPLIYDALNSLMYIDKHTGAFTLSPTTFDRGTYPVTFYVTNTRGETTTMTTEVRVA